MSEPASLTAPPADAVREGLRLVLFGRPGAGKTSLLGALSQAAQTQEHLLSGRLTEPAPALAGLRQQVYDATTRPTPEEVVLYPVEFEFFDHDGRAGGREQQKAVLIDCDGKAANDLLMRRQALDPDSAERPLAQEVLSADTLVLVVDASEPASQVEADFAEFGRFLRQFERGRGQRSEVGGLPVFLVLSKCDLLAQPGDAPVDWIERVEERKRQVGQRFREFLARRESDDGPLPFGRIDLHLWATAVKRPALAGTPAKPREPYGVAELFRQCLEHARLFHQRRRQSGRRLLWTVGGAAGLLALLVAVTAGLIGRALLNRDADMAQVRALENKIDNYRSQEGAATTVERLKGTPLYLRRQIGVLTELRDDPEFAKLPEDKQNYVTGRLQELQDYTSYYEKLQGIARRPAEAQTEAELKEIEQALKTDLAPRTAWSPTDAAQLHKRYLEQIAEIRAAVDRVVTWYRLRQKEGTDLWSFAGRQPDAGASIDWRDWHAAVENLLARADGPDFRDSDRLPWAGAPTYGETVLLFERVHKARQEWQATREKLERLRNLSAALGLGSPAGRPPLLAIPRRPPFTAADTPERSRELLQVLEKNYPQYKRAFVLADLPDAAAGDVRQAAATSYEPLLEGGRDVVLQKLQQAGTDDRETPQRWQTVREWLKDPKELESWRVLAGVLGRLKDAEAGDPVSDLAAFLGKGQFELDLRQLTLEIPDALKMRPIPPLSLYHLPTSKTGPALVFGDVHRDPQRRSTLYTFRPADGRGALTYRPGDELWATLALKDAEGRDWMFTWARSRSEVFQQERLTRPPRLHPKDKENVAGDLAKGVALTATEGKGIPPVPDLLPVVRLEKK